MPVPIVALESQNEKRSTTVGHEHPLRALPFVGDSLPDFRAAPMSANPVRSQGKEKPSNLWSKLSWPSFLILVLLGLGCFGLFPFLLLKPDKCGRFSFGLTLYKIGETRTEYDGQCLDNSTDQSMVDSIADERSVFK